MVMATKTISPIVRRRSRRWRFRNQRARARSRSCSSREKRWFHFMLHGLADKRCPAHLLPLWSGTVRRQIELSNPSSHGGRTRGSIIRVASLPSATSNGSRVAPVMTERHLPLLTQPLTRKTDQSFSRLYARIPGAASGPSRKIKYRAKGATVAVTRIALGLLPQANGP